MRTVNAEGEFRRALRVELRRADRTGSKAVERIARRLIQSAELGEPWAVKMVVERLDGPLPPPSNFGQVNGNIVNNGSLVIQWRESPNEESEPDVIEGTAVTVGALSDGTSVVDGGSVDYNKTETSAQPAERTLSDPLTP